MKIFSQISTKFVAAATAFALTFTPTFALSYGEIFKTMSTYTANAKFEVDSKTSDGIKANLDLERAVFAENPELFYSVYDLGECTFWSKGDRKLLSSVSFSDRFISAWNDENFKKSVWDYVDSAISCAGILDSDTPAQKVSKAAIFIGNNYRYDYDKAYAANEKGTSFFTSLTRDQISFCTPDAKLFMAMMTRLGIPAKYVEGNASGYHAWNKVFVDGKWSEVDCSFARKAKNKNKYIMFSSGRTIYGEIG